MLESELVEDLHKGDIDLDCPSVILKSNSGDVSYSGPGYIRQDENGWLFFTLYADKRLSEPKDPFLVSVARPGEMVPKDRFYTLNATDYRGRNWTSDHLLPHGKHLVMRQPLVISGELMEMRRSNDLTYGIGNTITMITLYGDFEFPKNTSTETDVKVNGEIVGGSASLDTAKFQLGQHEVTMKENDGVIHLEVDSPPGVSCDGLELRIIECFQFAFARSLAIATMMKWTGSTELHQLSSRPREVPKARVNPPIRYSSVTGQVPVYSLLDKYFRFVQDSPADHWHPISVHSYAVIESSASSLDARALGVGVAVEGLLKDVFKNLSDAPADLRESVEKVVDALKNLDISAVHKDRISGAVRVLLGRNAREKLGELESAGWIHREHVEAWTTLRNTWAHGDRPLSWDFQKVLDLVNSVTGLFNALVFAAIGYEGTFTDYSQRGWPDAIYPDSMRKSRKELTQETDGSSIEISQTTD